MNSKHLPMRTYAISERAEIDVTLSENPLGPSKEVIRAIRRAAKEAHQYPVDEKRLVAAIARHHGISEEAILLGAGANELLEDYLKVLALGKNMVAPTATFPEAVSSMGVLKGSVTAVPLLQDLSVDLEGLLQICTHETSLIHLCNPNNPTGKWLEAKEIGKLAQLSPVPVLVSEAGADWVGRTAIKKKMPPNLIVVRSFSKAYGLAGLRIGYSVAHPQLIARMKGSLRTYRVNSLALVAALAALQDQAHLQKAIAYTLQEKVWLMKALRGLGFEVVASQGQHFVAKVPKPFRDADHFCAMARQRGIAVVNCSLYPGLNQYIRVSPQKHKTNQMLIVNLKQMLRVV